MAIALAEAEARLRPGRSDGGSRASNPKSPGWLDGANRRRPLSRCSSEDSPGLCAGHARQRAGAESGRGGGRGDHRRPPWSQQPFPYQAMSSPGCASRTPRCPYRRRRASTRCWRRKLFAACRSSPNRSDGGAARALAGPRRAAAAPPAATRPSNRPSCGRPTLLPAPGWRRRHGGDPGGRDDDGAAAMQPGEGLPPASPSPPSVLTRPTSPTRSSGLGRRDRLCDAGRTRPPILLALVSSRLRTASISRPVAMVAHREGRGLASPARPGQLARRQGQSPAVHIAYEDALAYARWLGRDPPTEAEWNIRGAAADGARAMGDARRARRSPRQYLAGLLPLRNSGRRRLQARPRRSAATPPTATALRHGGQCLAVDERRLASRP